ncbi:MAG TPA: NrpR regulatory domain-containing protein [Deltaproteobacteria bacterium]|nr:NrpR regulatory domain-containing protein [Deltaproteobacteria bacterium]
MVQGKQTDGGADMNRVMFAILSTLEKHHGPVRSSQIVSQLASQGLEISGRTARHYLKMLDEQGFTSNCSRSGRMITDKGRGELRQGFAFDRVGFIIDRINRLSVQTDFHPDTGRGRVILNVSYVPEHHVERALEVLDAVFGSPYALNDRITIARGGEHIGDVKIPDGMAGIGTVCSITINGIFLRSGIPIRPRVGGIIEVANRKPVRFKSFISYEHSSVAPLEIFIRSRMTGVLDTLDTGSGCILGSFREIPGEGLFASRRLTQKLVLCGFRSTTLHGYAFQPLLGISVTEGMVGLVELGGLNPSAALAEAGLSANTRAMATMHEYADLRPLDEYLQRRTPGPSRTGTFRAGSHS